MPKGVKLKDKEGYVYPCPFFPVGSIYMSVNSTNPSTYFGGTWVEIQGRFLLGRSSSYAAGSQGGEASHKLTSSEMPSHNHSATINTASLTGEWQYYHASTDLIKGGGIVGTGSTGVSDGYTGTTSNRRTRGKWTINASHNHSGSIGSTGGNAAHNNMPPYLAVYIWKRIA